jgi:hypothetical protein
MENKKKILLVILPFWTPQIPPMGISCLKGFLNRQGFPHVKTVDANTEIQLREVYDLYFNTLERLIPEDRQGNYQSIGNEVWQNHMMAHINYKNENEYVQLVKLLVSTIFFCQLETPQVRELIEIIEETYSRLKTYFLHLLEEEKPGVLGLSVYIGNLPASVFAFRLTKKKYPHIMTVMGGGVFYDQLAIGTDNLAYFLEKTRHYIDKIIIGEGELLFLKLLQGKLPGKQRVYTGSAVDGEVLSLAEEQLPGFSDLKTGYYPYLAAYGSRSCPFCCSFCSDSIYWGRYRKKAPALVVRELKKLFGTYGYQLFYFSDLLLNPYITALAREFIKEKLSIYWDGLLRISEEVCDPGKTLLWRQGGFYRASLGCESGSQHVLDLMNKKITVEQSKAALSSLASAGIKTTTYWVTGHPGETEPDFRQTLDFLEEMKDDIYYAEGNVFWSVLTGRAQSGEWMKQGVPLYPAKFKDMLLQQIMVMDVEPTREERYERLHRFVQHCKKLGIHNPYSLDGIHKADERWKKLHKNAVPALADFKQKNTDIHENKTIKPLVDAPTILKDDGNWGF